MFKRFGFGFDDVETNDSRINTLDLDEQFDGRGYFRYLKEDRNHDSELNDWYRHRIADSFFFRYRPSQRFKLSDIIAYVPQNSAQKMENGKGFILVTPPGSREMNKLNLLNELELSGAEYAHARPDLARKQVGSSYVLTRPPYPYSYDIIDLHKRKCFYDSVLRSFLDAGGVVPENMVEDDRLYLSRYGSENEIRERYKVVPYTPLRSLVNFLGLFTDTRTWENMKPLVINYYE